MTSPLFFRLADVYAKQHVSRSAATPHACSLLDDPSATGRGMSCLTLNNLYDTVIFCLLVTSIGLWIHVLCLQPTQVLWHCLAALDGIGAQSVRWN